MASSSSNSIREEYLSSLADLDQNSKPMIDMLTMLAEDHRQHAPIIVDCIKQRLAQVRVKLPLLYLIDSIVKNVGDPYKQLFQQEIVGMFVDAFDKSKTDKVREKMFALRETWNDVFLQTKLYALDVKVNQIDQNWPIVAKVVTKNPKIHVNPNFLKKQMEPVDPIEQLQQELREKHRKLLELKNCKLELEMREMAKKIEEEQKKSSSSTASVVPSTSGMKSTVKVSPVGSALLDSVVGGVAAAASSSSVTAGKGSRTASASSTKNDKNKDGKSSSSSSSRKSSSTSPKSSSKSKSGSSSSSHRSSSNHHSGSKDRKRSSKRSSDESTEKSPSKRSRSSGSESVDGDKKAKHAAVMAKRIPKLAAGVTTTSTGDTDERIVSSTATSSTSPLKGATTIEGQAANQSKIFIDSDATVAGRVWELVDFSSFSPWNCVTPTVACCG